MPLLFGVFIIVGLFMLFPKGFKFLVGAGMGFTAMMLVWCVGALLAPPLFMNSMAFIALTVIGIVGGCIFAAKG